MQLGSYGSAYEGSNLLSLGYGYDQLGRITSRVERVLNTTNVYGYAYDAAGRLEEVRTNGSVRAVYGYDANGNRTNAVVAGVGSTGSYDGQDRMTSYASAVYQYTAGGTLTNKTQSGQTTSYRYDTRGNLLKVTLPGGTAVEYVIDGLGRRIGRKVNGTLSRGYLYMNGLKPVAELDGSMGVVNYFVYGAQGQTPDYLVRSGTTYRILSDHLGSVRLVVNAESGAIAQRMDYDEWGNVVQDTNPGFQPFAFAGGLYDPDTGLVRFGYRDYDAQTGRWLAKDPILFGGGQVNLYVYVDGDPVNYVDPSGLLSRMQCAALRELLRREQLYGTQVAAQMSSNTWGDKLLRDFNSDWGENGSDVNGVDIDWFTDVSSVAHIGAGSMGFTLMPTMAYLVGKSIWNWWRFLDNDPKTNPTYAFHEPQEGAAVIAVESGKRYRDIITPEYLQRECGGAK